MYLLFRKDTFYLKTENEGILFKNNFTNLEIKTPKSYYIFEELVKFLDGNFTKDQIVQNIKNDNIKSFCTKLLMSLMEKKFLYLSPTPLTNLSELEQKLIYLNSDDITKNINELKTKNNIYIRPNNFINNELTDELLKQYYLSPSREKENIKISIGNFNSEDDYSIVFQDDKLNIIKIPYSFLSPSKPKIEIPKQAWLICLNILLSELFLYLTKINSKDTFENSIYQLDLITFEGEFINR